MFESDLAYLGKQLRFAREARSHVGLFDALSRAQDALGRIEEQAKELNERLVSLNLGMDGLLSGEIQGV